MEGAALEGGLEVNSNLAILSSNTGKVLGARLASTLIVGPPKAPPWTDACRRDGQPGAPRVHDGHAAPRDRHVTLLAAKGCDGNLLPAE